MFQQVDGGGVVCPCWLCIKLRYLDLEFLLSGIVITEEVAAIDSLF